LVTHPLKNIRESDALRTQFFYLINAATAWLHDNPYLPNGLAVEEVLGLMNYIGDSQEHAFAGVIIRYIIR
jgi:hypothetical protein